MFELLCVVRDLLFLAGYLSGKTFPKPLSKEEEAKCLKASNQGDEAARHKLVEHNLRLVAHIVKKYQNTALANDDLISIGTIGLIKAVNSFLPKKGTQLATYAAKCIENAILTQCPLSHSKVSSVKHLMKDGTYLTALASVYI